VAGLKFNRLQVGKVDIENRLLLQKPNRQFYQLEVDYGQVEPTISSRNWPPIYFCGRHRQVAIINIQ